jgi:hypothetical protein
MFILDKEFKLESLQLKVKTYFEDHNILRSIDFTNKLFRHVFITAGAWYLPMNN